MNDPSPLDPALVAALDAEVQRVGVDLEVFVQRVVAAFLSRSSAHAVDTSPEDNDDWVPLLGLDLEQFITFLRTLPPHAGTEATVAAWLRLNDPPPIA